MRGNATCALGEHTHLGQEILAANLPERCTAILIQEAAASKGLAQITNRSCSVFT